MVSTRTFDLSGGRLCLDFANTLSGRLHGPTEHLQGFGDLVAFARQAGILEPAEAGRLEEEAALEPQAAHGVWRRAIVVREALFDAFAALATGKQPAAAALDAVNRELPEALGRLRIEMTPEGGRWRWETADRLDRVLWPILRSAGDLLASPEELRTLRYCAAEDCAWLFLDKSRNRSRRWCAMNVCGNRDKVRRHYRRLKAAR
jgi:predicted RNA-binding Zn ribbon-like protein